MDVSVSQVLSDFRVEKLSLETGNGDVLYSVPTGGAEKEETNEEETIAGDRKPLVSYFFSNFSAKVIFDMMANGSGGNVREGLLTHSHGKPIDRINEIYPYTFEFFTETGAAGGPRINISRAIWVHPSTSLKTDFHNVIQSFYGAQVHKFDDGDKESPVNTKVNGWLKEQSGRLLEDPFGSLVIGSNTRLVLATALKLEGEWFKPFTDAGVRDFTLLDGKNVQVPFMSSTGRHYVQQFKNYKLLSVPFKQHSASNFSMLFYLPDSIDDTKELRTYIGEFESVIQDVYFPKQQVQVGTFMIPKFTLKMRGPLPLSDYAFDQMADSPTGLISRGGLVSSFVEINEKGARAAGGTAFFIDEKQPKPRRKRSVDFDQGEIGTSVDIDFVADRPFFFFIRDNRFGRMLFSGGLINPVGQSPSFEPIDDPGTTAAGPEWLETVACRPSEEDPEWLETIACRPSEEDPEWLETIACHSKEE